MATNCALLAVLKVGGDMIKEGNLTPGALTRFAIQVSAATICSAVKDLIYV